MKYFTPRQPFDETPQNESGILYQDGIIWNAVLPSSPPLAAEKDFHRSDQILIILEIQCLPDSGVFL